VTEFRRQLATLGLEISISYRFQIDEIDSSLISNPKCQSVNYSMHDDKQTYLFFDM